MAKIVKRANQMKIKSSKSRNVAGAEFKKGVRNIKLDEMLLGRLDSIVLR